MTQETTAPATPVVAPVTTVPATPATSPEVQPVVVTLDTPEPAPTVAPDSSPATVGFEYEKTGDPGLDYALAFVGRLGFGHESPAITQAMTGDFALLRAELGSLGDKAKGYAEVVALAEQAFTRSKEKSAANDKALGEAATKIAGSKERWAEVQTWASSNADPQEKTAINSALAAGGISAKMAMEYLVRCFDKSKGGVQEPASAVQKSAASNAGPASGALSAREYSQAVQELSRTLKGREVENHPEYRALQQRRLASQKAGR